MEYEINEKKTGYILRGIRCDEITYIGEHIDDDNAARLPIKEIGDDVFLYNMNECWRLIIGNSVTRIGEGAFSDLENLTLVIIGENVEYISDDAFSNCPSISAVYSKSEAVADHPILRTELKSGVPFISDKYTYVEIDGCRHLINYSIKWSDKYIDIPEGIEVIDAFAVRDSDNIREICLPRTIKHLRTFAFKELIVSALEKIVFRGSLVEWVSVIRELRAFNMGRKTAVYTTENGVITKVGPVLRIPEGVKTIKDYNFAYLRDIEEIYLPDSLEKIHDNPFADCYNLLYIRLGKNLKAISSYAFSGCDRLIDIENRSQYITLKDGHNFPLQGIRSCNCSNEETFLTNCSFDDKSLNILNDAAHTCDFIHRREITHEGHIMFRHHDNERSLIKYNQLETSENIIVPDEVTFISKGAFILVEDFTSVDVDTVYLGKNTSIIGQSAFTGARNLNCRNIIIPSKVKYILNSPCLSVIHLPDLVNIIIEDGYTSLDISYLDIPHVDTVRIYVAERCCGIPYFMNNVENSILNRHETKNVEIYIGGDYNVAHESQPSELSVFTNTTYNQFKELIHV